MSAELRLFTTGWDSVTTLTDVRSIQPSSVETERKDSSFEMQGRSFKRGFGSAYLPRPWQIQRESQIIKFQGRILSTENLRIDLIRRAHASRPVDQLITCVTNAISFVNEAIGPLNRQLSAATTPEERSELKLRSYPGGKDALGPKNTNSRLVDSMLERSGWNRKVMDSMPRSLQLRYHLSFYDGAKVSISPHTHTPSATTTARHVNPGCKCRSLDISKYGSATRFVQGTFPVCRFRADMPNPTIETEYITLSPQDRAPLEYVALLHVRDMGLRCEPDARLPTCQLARLQTWVDKALGPKPDGQGGFWWLDTVCEARFPQQQPTAIAAVEAGMTSQRWDVFAAARFALVLDPQLLERWPGSSLERVLRIRYSAWRTACDALALGFASQRRLLFQFRERALSKRGSVEAYKRDAHGDDLERAARLGIRLLARPRLHWHLTKHYASATADKRDRDAFAAIRLLWRDMAAWQDLRAQQPQVLAVGAEINNKNLKWMVMATVFGTSDYQFFLDGAVVEKAPFALDRLRRVYGGFASAPSMSAERIGRRLVEISR
ncbi:hypothetical protein B0T26DRAFT_679442 [Lasiosphaeria miniovina]|uniref:Uncharacterized protein n=1 Tax=Lasiosphaeria miniovina TaxID=1954250 RepID=A0AA40DR21_9PEZI|nr:uncharacterized protein B0T26DRAFT_679442 [Lasiosphaeria miniovina]KAK0710122.1 hypothetical protein B0T26DRAFT_679442 [Lasiosphaeria miniovina]